MLNPHSPNVYISTNLAKNNAIQTANSKLYEHLPKMLNCKVCGNNKPVQAFSKTQLLKAAPSVYGQPRPAAHKATCKDCTPQPIDKYTCYTCTKTLPLKAFAKAQRKYAERARCMKCVKWFSDEGDASYESSTDSESESNSEVRGAAKTDSNDKDDDIKSTITSATGRSRMSTDTTTATTKGNTKKEEKMYTTWNDILPLKE